jgi:hypothetical protein
MAGEDAKAWLQARVDSQRTNAKKARMKEGSAAFVGANFAKPRAPKRPPAAHWKETNSGRVWKRWGRTPCYNSRREIRPDALHCHKPCRPELTPAKKAAGEKSLWMRALNEWNKSNGNWCVPTKDKIDNMYTNDYVEVLDIMERLKREDAQRDAGADDDGPQDEDDVPLTEFVPQTRTKAATAIQRAWRNRHRSYTQRDEDRRFERAMEKSGGKSAFRLPRATLAALKPKPKSTNRVKLLNVIDVYKNKTGYMRELDQIRSYNDRADIFLRKGPPPKTKVLVGVIRPNPTYELD